MNDITDEVDDMIVDRAVDSLFDKDMRWTRIYEMVKMRAPISADDKEYFESKMKEKINS